MTPGKTAGALTGGTGGATALVAVLDWAGISIPAPVAVIVGGAAIGVAGYVMHHGIRGAIRTLWNGSQTTDPEGMTLTELARAAAEERAKAEQQSSPASTRVRQRKARKS